MAGRGFLWDKVTTTILGMCYIVLLRPLSATLALQGTRKGNVCVCPWLAASGQRVDHSLPLPFLPSLQAKEDGPRRSHPEAWIGRSAQPQEGQARKQTHMVVLRDLLLFTLTANSLFINCLV